MHPSGSSKWHRSFCGLHIVGIDIMDDDLILTRAPSQHFNHGGDIPRNPDSVPAGRVEKRVLTSNVRLASLRASPSSPSCSLASALRK